MQKLGINFDKSNCIYLGGKNTKVFFFQGSQVKGSYLGFFRYLFKTESEFLSLSP